MKFNKTKYLKMVDFLRANTGRIFALYDPPHGQRVKALGFESQTLIKVPGLKNKEDLVFHLKHYISNYKLYPDEPIVTFSEDYTKIKIQESFNHLTNKKK